MSTARKACGRELPAGSDPFHFCIYPRARGKQRCFWHWLMAQSPDVQRADAEKRLAAWGEVERRARVPKEEWPEGERWCAGCQSFVPLFYTSGSRCKSCASSAAHAARTEKVYGITAEQYDWLFKRQGGRCAVCRNKPRSQRLAVDHDHQTGAVRGLLCKRCNHDLLGGGHDDPALLWRAIGYLLFPPYSYDQSTVTEMHVQEALAERLRLAELLKRPDAQAEPPPF